MFKLAVFGIVLVAFAVNCEGDGKDKCMKLFHPRVVRCCKNQDLTALESSAKECQQELPPLPKEKPTGPPPCDMEVCMAKKGGFLEDDGKTINKDAIMAKIKEHSSPAIAESIEKHCIDGNLDSYGPKDFCDLIKLRHCMQLQWLLQCEDLDTEGECLDIKENIEECHAAMGA